MADFARGFLVYGASQREVRDFMAGRRYRVFLPPQEGDHVCVFPDLDFEQRANELALAMPQCTVVMLLLGPQPMDLRLWRRGRMDFKLKLPQEEVPPAELTNVNNSLAQLANALPHKPSPPSVNDGKPVRDKVYALLGTKQFAHRNYHSLTNKRNEARDEELAAFVHVDQKGFPQAFYPGDSLPSVAPAAAGAGKKAKAAPSGPPPGDGPTEAFVDLANCATARQWLDLRKRVDPLQASPELLEELESVIREGRFASEGEISIVVREAAAMLLGRSLKAQKARDAEERLARGLRSATTPAERSAWKVAERVRKGPG